MTPGSTPHPPILAQPAQPTPAVPLSTPAAEEPSDNIIFQGEDQTPTPNLSSPTTPRQADESPHTVHLQTPTTVRFAEQVPIAAMDQPSPSGSGSGSGSGDEFVGMVGKGKDKERGGQRELVPPGEYGQGQEEEEKVRVDLSNTSETNMHNLQRIQKRLGELVGMRRDGDGWAHSDELCGMLKSVLPLATELPFLQERLAAQRDTIATMQMQSKLSEQLVAVERQRHMAERDAWHAETKALVKLRDAEIAAGIRPKRLLDLDVGYHQELEAANKRLEMDNRLMAPRLADTQRQIDKLVAELRLLRSNVILSSQPLTRSGDAPGPSRHSHPATPYHATAERRKSRSPVKGSGRTTMGDARTEHLLLAARRVRTMRQADDRVGRLTLEELKRNGVVGPGGGVSFSEGYGGLPESEGDADESEEEEKPIVNRRPSMSAKGKNRSQQQQPQPHGTPLLPRPKKSKKMATPAVPQTPSKSRSGAHAPPQTTPGGSNFNDLLRAAELAERPGSPTPDASMGTAQKLVPLSAMSATRSTTRTRDESPLDRGSPKRARGEDWGNSSGREEIAELVPTQVSASQQSASALDLLAQASQLDVAQSGDRSSESSDPHLSSAMRLGSMMRSSPPIAEGEAALGPAIDLAPFRPFHRPPDADANERESTSLAVIDLSDEPPPQPTDNVTETPKTRPRATSNASELATPARGYASSQIYPTPGGLEGLDDTPASALGAYASPTGATIPGIGKYVHLSGGMPSRRIRSPYLKWTTEEDELLARAVAIHGEKWDLVSKGVPTRSYHQVRQRWLRKTGAFDKKPSSDNSISNLGHPPSEGYEEEEDDDVSPSPTAGKKRKYSVSGGYK